jgi:transposase
MSLTHLPGDRLFVDYAGDPAFYTDPTTGMLQKAWIFVAVWPYSGLFYAEATRTQSSVDWLGAHVRALEAFGVAPKAIVPDFVSGNKIIVMCPSSLCGGHRLWP